MKKIVLLFCLLVASVAAQAQFEKGKWFINPGITGMNLVHSTENDKTSFGLEAQGGYFLFDNFALMANLGGSWNTEVAREYGSDIDTYRMGAGVRYYFDKVGIFVGGNCNIERWCGDYLSETKFSFGMEAGYAFFLSRTVTLEPSFYWNLNEDRSRFGVKLGFGVYF